jgi:hypothetical protein
MPFQHESIDGGRGVEFRGSGHLTGAEIIAIKQQILAEGEAMRSWKFGFVLLTGLDSFEISVEEVRAIADLDKAISVYAPIVVLAVVAPRDHDFGMARMWESVIDVAGWSTAVFRTRAEAEAWMLERLPSSSDATEPQH